MTNVMKVNDLNLRGALNGGYGDELLRLAKVLDDDKSIVARINMVNCLFNVCTFCQDEYRKNDFDDVQRNKVVKMFKEELKYFYDISDDLYPKAYILCNYMFYLFEAQIDLFFGNLQDSVINYKNFLNYTLIAEDFNNNKFYKFKYEVLFNIIKIYISIGQKENAIDIFYKNELLFKERVEWITLRDEIKSICDDNNNIYIFHSNFDFLKNLFLNDCKDSNGDMFEKVNSNYCNQFISEIIYDFRRCLMEVNNNKLIIRYAKQFPYFCEASI